MDDSDDIEELHAHLNNVAEANEYEAAHHREFIPDGYPASAVVVHAIGAAVAQGYALGVRYALTMLPHD